MIDGVATRHPANPANPRRRRSAALLTLVTGRRNAEAGFSDFSNRLQDGRDVENFAFEQKSREDNNFQLVLQWVFSMSFNITKVKLLFLGGFYVLFVHMLRK